MKKSVILLLFIFFTSLLVGCSSSGDIYKDFSEYNNKRYEQMFEKNPELVDMDLGERGYYYAMKARNTVVRICPVIAAVSIIIGIITLFAIRKEAKARKTAVFTFIIGIPALCFCVVFLVAAIAATLE